MAGEKHSENQKRGKNQLESLKNEAKKWKSVEQYNRQKKNEKSQLTFQIQQSTKKWWRAEESIKKTNTFCWKKECEEGLRRGFSGCDTTRDKISSHL